MPHHCETPYQSNVRKYIFYNELVCYNIIQYILNFPNDRMFAGISIQKHERNEKIILYSWRAYKEK